MSGASRSKSSLRHATAHADLVATFTRDGATDSRIDRLPAISVPAGEPATPFLTPGAFQVVWKGKLVMPRRQRLIFSFEGEGTATLKIAGKDVLTGDSVLGGKASESTRLNPGEHEFELSYSSKPDGTASFRLLLGGSLVSPPDHPAVRVQGGGHGSHHARRPCNVAGAHFSPPRTA